MYTHFDDEIEHTEGWMESVKFWALAILLSLATIAIILNFSGMIDGFINSFN